MTKAAWGWRIIRMPLFVLIGSYLALVLAAGQAQLGYATVSEKLARQIQHLLLRFGIIASLRKRNILYQDTRRPAWQLGRRAPP